MSTTAEIMALAHQYKASGNGVFVDAKEVLRAAIDAALLEAHKAGFDAALKPGQACDESTRHHASSISGTTVARPTSPCRA